MNNIAVIDSKNYDITWKKQHRIAVRAIIFKNKKLAMIKSEKFGEYKFPGGGIKGNESFLETLTRETREETGLVVIESSIKEYGSTIELRKKRNKDIIIEQISYYFYCEVTDDILPVELDDYEKEYGYKLTNVSIEEAIFVDEKIAVTDEPPWIKRELIVLRSLQMLK